MWLSVCASLCAEPAEVRRKCQNPVGLILQIVSCFVGSGNETWVTRRAWETPSPTESFPWARV